MIPKAGYPKIAANTVFKEYGHKRLYERMDLKQVLQL